MPQPKNKKKGGNKGKNRHPQQKGKKKGGHGNKSHHSKHPSPNQSKHKGKGHGKHQQHNHSKSLNTKQQQRMIESRMIESIDSMYSKYTNKNESMRTFFGIFTKHNQLQLRELMNASIPHINKRITDKFLKQTQFDENRDINQFIFLGDVVIGAYTTIVQNNKDCVIKALCVLPYFINYGFGSRLLVNLIKNCVKRKKLVTISLLINEENKKGILFFERFGFKIMNKNINNNQQNINGHKTEKLDEKKTGKKTEKKTENKDDINDNDVETIKMRLDLRIYRSSIMVLVKKQLKAEASSTNTKKT